jgi:hypothetical protein
MGIVCYCPNGHRVKVKDRFAGLRGLCPHCGAKFRIGAAPAGGPPAVELPLARFVPLEPAVIATLPRALPFGTAHAAAEAATESHDMFEPLEAPAGPLHAAIADRPELSWCIAYPGGTPSEPVDAATMQDWLAGGQAEGTELVWRADWAEWRPVHEVFPEFFSYG